MTRAICFEASYPRFWANHSSFPEADFHIVAGRHKISEKGVEQQVGRTQDQADARGFEHGIDDAVLLYVTPHKPRINRRIEAVAVASPRDVHGFQAGLP